MDAAQGSGRYKLTIPRDFKNKRAATAVRTATTTAAVQQHLRFKLWLLVTATALLCSYVCAVFTRRYMQSRSQFHPQFLNSNTSSNVILPYSSIYSSTRSTCVGTPDGNAPSFPTCDNPGNLSQPHLQREHLGIGTSMRYLLDIEYKTGIKKK